MSSARLACLVGGILLALSGVLCGGAFLAEVTDDPGGGADIGAAVLLSFGQSLAYIGVVLLFVSLVSYGRSAGTAQR